MSVVSDHFSVDEFEKLLADAVFFARRVHELNFIEQCRKRYAVLGAQAALSATQADQLREIAGWV